MHLEPRTQPFSKVQYRNVYFKMQELKIEIYNVNTMELLECEILSMA